MEQFDKLPFQQKVAVLIGVMVAVAGLFYYAMLLPLDDQATQAAKTQDKTSKEVAKLKKETNAYKKIDFKAQSAKLEEDKKHFEQLLPPREELVSFITGLSELAKAAGLTLIKFEKRPAIERHYYMEVPIQMEVLGTFRELIGFIRAVSDKDRRVINLRDLNITTTAINIVPVLMKYHVQRHARYPPGTNLKALSVAQKFMWRVKAYEELILGGLDLSAKFTAYVFVYTGKKASEDAAGAIAADDEIKKKLRESYGKVNQ